MCGKESTAIQTALILPVHRLANNGDVAGGQLAVFQGAVRSRTGGRSAHI